MSKKIGINEGSWFEVLLSAYLARSNNVRLRSFRECFLNLFGNDTFHFYFGGPVSLQVFHQIKFLVVCIMLLATAGVNQSSAQSVAPMERMFNGEPDMRMSAVQWLVPLASSAYFEGDEDVQLPEGIEPAEPKQDFLESGLGVKAFKFEEESLIIVAYAGTDVSSIKDLLTDYDLIKPGTKPQQFHEAWEFYTKVVEANPKFEVLLTGHSLGGALATYVAMRGKKSVVAFNSPGLNKALQEDIPVENMQSFVSGPWYVNYRSSSSETGYFRFSRDPISMTNERFKSMFIFDLPTGCDLDRLCHGLNNFERKRFEK